MDSLIPTVNGPVSAAALGRTYVHEHVFVLSPEFQENYPEEWGTEQARIDQAVAQLSQLADQGVQTIFDPTVLGIGRSIPRIQKIAARVPQLNIVVATGVYTFDMVPRYFLYRGAGIGGAKRDPMTDMFVRDLVDGIADTGVKAGFLKCAIDVRGLTEGIERIFRAIAAAHHETGAPITVHTHPAAQTGLDVKRIFCDEEGVDPQRIILGHCGDSSDYDQLAELADWGFILGLDRFGSHRKGITFDMRIATLLTMCERGYADRLVLSHDSSVYMDWSDQALRASQMDWNFFHLADHVIPYVLERGVTSDQIEEMLVHNPRRFITAGGRR